MKYLIPDHDSRIRCALPFFGPKNYRDYHSMCYWKVPALLFQCDNAVITIPITMLQV